MGKTTRQAPPSLAELRQRILDGHDVTPAEYAQARTLAELDELQALADAQAAARQAEADRLDHIRQIKARVIDAEAAADDRADTATIRDAVVRIIGRHLSLARAVRAARADLARLGVPEGDEIEGLRWQHAGMGYGDCVAIDGRRLCITANPGFVIADALGDACTVAGSPHHLSPGVQFDATPKSRIETDDHRQARLKRAAEMRATLFSQETAE